MADPLFLIAAGLLGALLGAGAMRLRGRRAPAELTPVPLPALSAERPDAVMVLDVDGLGELNARHGPDAGDRLIERIADVTARALPPGGAMERLDGGRFVLWLGGGVQGAEALAERLRTLGARISVDAGGTRVSRTLSAGVVPLSGEEGRARALMAATDALARAKGRGGDRVGRTRAPDAPRGPSAEEVEAAIAAGDIGYHVQPIFDLASGRPVGMEALVRWVRRDGTMLRPSDFLHRLSRLPEAAVAPLVELAAAAARPFVQAPAPLYVSFNVTAGALEDRGSPACLWLRSLAERLPTDQMMLELLESAVITHPDLAQEALDWARARGMRIALDDFGTGLSNIDRLIELRPDIVKLDRILLTGLGEDPRAEAVLKALAEAGAKLKVPLIAEGIETPADAELLRAMGIRYGQGFHLGRPAPAADWAKRLL